MKLYHGNRTMILFKQDWRHYPQAIVDTKTRNTSFLRLADKYRQMGIEHYYMILALHNPELQGIDPYDPTLTAEQKLAITYECKTNIWYHIREVARFPAAAGVDPMPFVANRGNIALIWCFLCHITAILIQPRQTFKSGSVDILTDWIIDVAGNHTKMLMITKDAGLMSDQITRIKSMRDLLPKYLYSKHKLDMDNKSGLNNTALANEYKTGVARSNKMQANNLGRGVTVPILHIDEAPFITWIGITLPAARAAGTKVRDLAERNGSLYGTIFTTTAGRRDDRDGGYMYDLVSQAMPWNEVIFDCRDRFDAMRMVDRASRGAKSAKAPMINITMSHRQLGYTDEWLFKAMREAGGTREEMERDFLNIWNSGSQRSPLTAELNKKIHSSMKDPVITDVSSENYIVRWYVSDHELMYLKKHSKIILGLDSSDASGRDAIAMVFTDAATLSVIGTATVGLSNLVEYARWLANFMVENPMILLVPERKSSAISIVDMLLLMLPEAGIDPFKCIYNTIVQEGRLSTKGEEAFGEILRPMSQRDEFFYTERKAKFGFITDKVKRDQLYGTVLQQAAKQAASQIHDATLIGELLGLTVKNERVDHSRLGHDDHVVAWLLTHWLVNHGMNLSHYGIEPGLVMSALVQETEVQASISEQWQSQVQKAYLSEIDTLVMTLSETSNEALIALYERKLQFLSRKVEASGTIKDFSVDGVMEKVRREREKRQRLSLASNGFDPDHDRRQAVENTINQFAANGYRMSNRWHG